MAVSQRKRTEPDPYENASHIHVGPFCHEPGFRGYGNPSSGVVFVGIAPGRDEVKSGRPFTGQSGKLLNSYLDALGFARHNVYCTNLICWWKDDPTREEYEKCRPRLMRELAELKPKLIILMGALVTDYILGKTLSGVNGSRGSVTWSNEFNAYIMPTNHPAAVLHTNDRESASGDKGAAVAMDIWRDLSKIQTIINEWPLDDSLQHVQYAVVESKEQAQQILDNLPRMATGIPVAVDVETSSPDEDEMDFTSDALLCLSVATPDFSWVFPREVLDDLVWPLDNVRWTFHFGLFDTQVLREHLGLWFPIVEDTLLQSYSLDERPGYHRLKPLAREYNGAGWWEVERKALRGKLHTIPKPALYRYNGYDGGNTARLQVKLESRQRADNVRDMYEQILIPAANTINRIQYDGIKVDLVRLHKYAIKWGQHVLDLEASVQEAAFEYGWPRELGPINLNSPKQLSSFIYGTLSLPNAPGAKKQSTDAKNLERLRGSHPFIDKLSSFRKWDKGYTTYIAKLFDHIKRDGRCHSVVKLHGTVTGRLAYSDPPLQTIPREYDSEEDWAQAFKHLRKLFIPNEPDHVVLQADYGKAELWVGHYYSGDPQMLADLQSGDYHKMVAANVLGIPYGSVTGDQKVAFKKVNFGVMYGREAHSLSEAIGSTITEAADFIQGFYNRNILYKAFLDATQKTAINDGELVTVTGRKRRFLFMGGDWDHRALKQAINYPIQSTTSDYTLMSVVDLYPLLAQYGAYIMLTVHDSIVVGCPKENVDIVARIMHDVMIRSRWLGPLPVEIKLGASWGAGKIIHTCESQGSCVDARRNSISSHEPEFNYKTVRKLLKRAEVAA